MIHRWILLPCSAYLLLKVWYRKGASVADLDFLLYPTSRLVTLVGGGSGEWRADHGYFHPAGNFIINAGCAGFNFFLFVFLVLYLMLRRPGLQQYWLLPAALITAWPITVVANASRIISLLRLGEMLPAASRQDLVHQLTGGLIYVTVLTGLALSLHYLPAKFTVTRAKYS